MSRILLTGAGGAGTSSLWEQWRTEHELFFADANADAFAPSIPAERRVVWPLASDPDFIAKAQAACQALKIDLLIPSVDEELLPLALQHGRPGWPRLFLPPAAFVKTMLDKLDSMQAIAAAGLTAPRTVPLSDTAAWQQLAFPLILKPRKGRGSRGVVVVREPAHIAAYLTLNDLNAVDAVAQELAVGQEYTVFAYADDAAQLRAVVPVKVLYKRGITVRACTDDNPAVVDCVAAFQRAFEPTGPYNLQCIQTADGRVVPFEINPRVSTTFCLALAAGADPLRLDERLTAGPTQAPFRSSKASWSLNRSWLNHIVCTTNVPTFHGEPHA